MGIEPQQPLQEGHTHGNTIDEMIRENRRGVPSEEEMASRYILPNEPQLGEAGCEGPRGEQPMAGMLSNEAAASQLRTGGGNPFMGVSLGLEMPKGMGRGRGSVGTPQRLPKPRGEPPPRMGTVKRRSARGGTRTHCSQPEQCRWIRGGRGDSTPTKDEKRDERGGPAQPHGHRETRVSERV